MKINRSFLIHSFWALVAVSAFAIGQRQSPSLTTTSPSSAENDSTLARSARSSDLSNRPTPSARASASNRSSTQNSNQNLSPAGISQLGLNLKSAKGPIERREAFAQILANLTPENALALREQIVHLDPESSEFKDFHYQWGALGGKDAVLNGLDTPQRDLAITLAGWASSDPTAALAYYNSLTPDERNAGGQKYGAIVGLIETNPALAASFIRDQEVAGDGDANRLARVAAEMMKKNQGLEEASKWVASLPEGPLQKEAVSQIARDFADSNPQASLAWANNLPTGAAKTEAIETSFNRWARQDPERAASEIEKINDPATKDAALYGYTRRVAWDDPEAGIAWANSIANQQTRGRALYETARAYLRNDSEKARAWLPNSGLTAEQIQRVTSERRR